MGVRPAAVARFNWALGGALAGLAGVLYAPLTNINAATFTFLLVKTVGAALIGGLVSLPLTFAGGIALGLVETLLPHFWARPGSASVGITALVVVALMSNTKRLALYAVHASSPATTAARVELALGLAESLVGLGAIGRRVPRVVWPAVALGVAAIPLQSEFRAAIGLHVVFYVLAGLSLVLITGSAGQPSLMQMGFVGVGAYTITTATYHGVSFGAALALGVTCCFVVGLAVGALTLRFRGVEFAILTLTLAAMVSEGVLADPRLFSTLSTPRFLGLDLLHPRSVYIVMLGFTAVRVFSSCAMSGVPRGAERSSHSGTGRGSSPIRRQCDADGGDRVRHLVRHRGSRRRGLRACWWASSAPSSSSPLYSITLLLAALVGGLRSLWGPVLTGVIFGVGPIVLQRLTLETSNAYPQIVSSLLVLVLLVAAPDGLASLGDWARATLARAPSTPVFRGRPFPATSRRAMAGGLARSPGRCLLPRCAPRSPGATHLLHRPGGGAVPRLPRAQRGPPRWCVGAGQRFGRSRYERVLGDRGDPRLAGGVGMDQSLRLGAVQVRWAARRAPVVALTLLLLRPVPAGAAGDIAHYDGRARASVMSFSFHMPDAVFPFTIEGGSFDSTVVANSLPQGFATAGVFPVPVASSVPLLINSKLPQQVQDALRSIDYTNTPNYCQAVWPPAKPGLDEATCGGPQTAAPAPSSATANGHVKTTGDFAHPLETRSLAQSRGEDLAMPTLQATVREASSEAVSGLNSAGVPQSQARTDAHLVELLDGKVKLHQISSETTVANDGTMAGRSATTAFSLGSATILGVPVHIGQDGFTVATQEVGVDATKSLTEALSKSADINGFSIRLFPAPPVTNLNGVLSAESGGVEIAYNSEKPTPAHIVQRFGYTAASMGTLTMVPDVAPESPSSSDPTVATGPPRPVPTASDVESGSPSSSDPTVATGPPRRVPATPVGPLPTSDLVAERSPTDAQSESSALPPGGGGAAETGVAAGTTVPGTTRTYLAERSAAAQTLDPDRVRYLYTALAVFLVAVPVLFRVRRAI